MQRQTPTQAALAAGLGISQAMASKLVAKGMPTSSVRAAKAWRAKNLDPMRAKGTASGSLDRLRQRKLDAEVRLAEAKAAKAGAVDTLSRQAIERALFHTFISTRSEIDNLHPRLLNRLDEFCPESDPRYGPLFTDLFRLCRETWANSWARLAYEFAKETPQLETWFRDFIRRERGRRGDEEQTDRKPGDSH
jgi:hypothetical protein